MQVARRHLGRRFSTGLGVQDIPGPKEWPVIGAWPDFVKRIDGMKHPKGPMMLKAHQEYYKEFGEIYKLNLVGDTQIAVCRPETYMQIYRNEGIHPIGAGTSIWILKKWAEDYNREYFKEWTGVGEPWRKIRMVVQEDIIGPKTARSYLPYINEAVRLASPHLPHFAAQPDVFVTRLSFDMFSSLFYGVQMNTASPSPSEEHLSFVEDTVEAFRLMGQAIFNRHLQMSIFKYHSLNREFPKVFNRSYEYSEKLMDEALERCKNMPPETKPYIVRIVERESMPVEGIKEIAPSFMQAGIDTTQSVINWNLLYLATNPEKQEILRQELKDVLGDGDLTEEIAANMKSKLPYLKACMRETHRIAPPSGIMATRPAPCDLVLDGYSVPAGSMVIFNTFALQNDPKYVDEPDVFKPERWLPEAVKARKGTEAEVIDDKLLATPFSFGARMCLGGRVADLELAVALARLIRDWRISAPVEQGSWRTVQPLLNKAEPFPGFGVEAA